VSYTKFDADHTCYVNSVARLYLDDLSFIRTQSFADKWTEIYHTAPCLPFKEEAAAITGHQAGGRIVFDGEHTIYLASGGYAWDGDAGPWGLSETSPALPQDPRADYGKIIAIDIETGVARQFSRGHRNPQGIVIDREGVSWAVEHGPRGGDELNQIIEGGNYGWPLESYGTRYNELPLPGTLSYGRHETFRRPSIAWLPSIAVSGLSLVEGFHEAWDGDLLAASLAGQMLVRIRLADERVVFTEFIPVGIRIRYVHQHTNGQIVLWTDGGQLVFLSPGARGLGAKYVEDRLAVLQAEGDVAGKVQFAFARCVECHSLDEGNHINAPSLARIYGAEIGSTAFSKYSDSMLRDKRVWNEELLRAFLQSPEQVIPQTDMPGTEIEDPVVIDQIVSILEGLATDAWTTTTN